MTDAQKASRLRALIHRTHDAGVQLERTLHYLISLNARRRSELALLEGRTQQHAGKQFGLDWAWGTIGPGALRAHHATFACRYLSYDSAKNLKPSESRILGRAGIGRVVVWETTASRALDGLQAGESDAREAERQARACGKPPGAPIFFAVDFDTTGNGQAIHAYFAGVNRILPGRVGAYGGHETIRTLFDAGLISYGWQTYAWSYGQWDPRAHLQQYSNGHPVAGVDTDYNRTDGTPTFGQW
jgi:hypothetical protein